MIVDEALEVLWGTFSFNVRWCANSLSEATTAEEWDACRLVGRDACMITKGRLEGLREAVIRTKDAAKISRLLLIVDRTLEEMGFDEINDITDGVYYLLPRDFQ